MPISPSGESQNTAITGTNESKTGSTIIWDEAYATWDESTGTWINPGIMANKESQNSIGSGTNESPQNIVTGTGNEAKNSNIGGTGNEPQN